MKKSKMIKKKQNFDELLDVQYGKRSTKKHDAFEENAKYFVIREKLQKESKLVQEESMKVLAEFDKLRDDKS